MDYVAHPNHCLAVSEKAFDPIGRQHSLRGSEFTRHFCAPASAVDRKTQLLDVKRLLEKVQRSLLEHFQCGRRVSSPTETYDGKRNRKIGRGIEKFATRLRTISPGIDVEQND